MKALKALWRGRAAAVAERSVAPSWAPFLAADPAAWAEARRRARGGPKVLMATSSGGHNLVTVFEGLLGIALTLRGADVSFLLCDQALPACIRANVHAYPDAEVAEHGLSRTLCGTCWQEAKDTVGRIGLPVLRQGDLVTAAERSRAADLAATVSLAEIPRHRFEGLAVGEHAQAGAVRYFARAELGGEPHGERILRRYFEAALLSAFTMRRALQAGGFEATVFNHGLYVPFGVFGEVARQEGRRVANWCVSYRRLTFIFSHGDTYHHTLMDEPTSAWEDMAWDPAREAETTDYLRSRWKGTRDWVYFHEKPEASVDAIVAELGVDRDKPIVGVLTNVVWDAQLHYPTNAFGGILPWLVETVHCFASRPDLQAVIRVHPAEVRGTLPSRQRITDELARAFPDGLPRNVFVVPPESPISTYAVLEICNAAIIYGTKMGVELTSVGIPVIVAGEAWIRNKGLTHDARTVEEYRQIFDRLPFASRLSRDEEQRARRYAYHFFFRRMIPVHQALAEAEGPALVRPTARTVDDLRPGVDPGLDVICDGILHGRPFVYDGPVGEPPARQDA